jgi:hypothetical protein
MRPFHCFWHHAAGLAAFQKTEGKALAGALTSGFLQAPKG